MNLPVPASTGKRYTAAFIVFLVLTGALYYPSLDSQFILDDYYNLVELDQIESKGYLYYIFSGIAGPSGRPLSTLSFALQHADWPANPFSFKTVNLVIHLLNGVLVFFISRLLAGYLKCSRKESVLLACLVAGFWLIHPVHVNTVLYVVQRMTEISGFFVLAGMLAYLRGRRYYEDNRPRAGFTVMGLAVFFGTVLAVLGKENGILLPLFILATEFTLLHEAKRNADWKAWAWFFLGLPLLALAVYFTLRWDSILVDYERRPFTMGQRLLTEAVILFVYLRLLCLPRPDSFSFYHDDFPVSAGFFSPPYTIFAVIGIIGLFTLAVINRKRYPVVSFAVLWFLAGHALESSFIDLELFFEHRNYLPSIGICFLLGWFSIFLCRRFDSRLPGAVFVLLFCGLLTAVSARVVYRWNNPLEQAIAWVENNPDSMRALDNLANVYLVVGRHEMAREVYGEISRIQPDDIYPYLKEITISYCLQDRRLPEARWQEMYEKAAGARRYGLATVAEIDNFVREIQRGNCVKTDIPKLMRLALILAGNPEFRHSRGPLHELLALLAIEIKDGDTALANIRQSIIETPAAHRLILEVRLLLALGRIAEAEAALERTRDFLTHNPKDYLANWELINRLENRLREKRVSPANSTR